MTRLFFFLVYGFLLSGSAKANEQKILQAYMNSDYKQAIVLLKKEIQKELPADKEEGWQRIVEDIAVEQAISLLELSEVYDLMWSMSRTKRNSKFGELSKSSRKLHHHTKELSERALVSFNELYCKQQKFNSVFCVILTAKAIKSKKNKYQKKQLKYHILARQNWSPGTERYEIIEFIDQFPKDPWSPKAYKMLEDLYHFESRSSSGPVGLSEDQKHTLRRLKKKLAKH